jgi:hypothetical protein
MTIYPTGIHGFGRVGVIRVGRPCAAYMPVRLTDCPRGMGAKPA